MYKAALLACLLLLPAVARADSSLFYLELQGIAGYSFAREKFQYYSMNPEAEMQKPTVGFDYLHRFSGESGDWGSLGLQMRLALVAEDESLKDTELQLYNAWVRVKSRATDAWAGHFRPALGLGSYFDSHGLLLRTLPIQGFGYDRDWGIGTWRDTQWGNVSFSATTGSGMPLRQEGEGNYLLAGRVSYGVLNEDNYNFGLSAALGETLDTMGYTLREPDPRQARLVGTDFAVLRDDLEHRFDLLAGEWLGEDTLAAMYRLTWVLDPEARTKLEAQPMYWKSGEESWMLSLCGTHLVTADLTARLMYEYDTKRDEQRVVMQLYFYKPL